MEGMRGKEVWKAAKATAGHALLLTFTIVLVLKLHPGSSSLSWWFIFSPLWLFHAVMYRSRFSIPVPSTCSRNHIHWDPFHSVVAMPLLIAFELLLCVYLESSHVNQISAVNLEIVFLPIFLLETIILLENLRTLCLEDFKIGCLGEELTPDQQECYAGVHDQKFITSMVTFFMAILLAVTVFLVQIITGNGEKLSFWLPYFLSYPAFVFGVPIFLESMGIHDQLWKFTEGQSTSAFVALFVIGGQFYMTVLILGFPILLCMYVEGTPNTGTKIPIPISIVFSPLFLLQGVGVLFSTLHIVERIVFLAVHSESGNGRYLTPCSRACDFLVSIGHGLRFLGWGSIDDGSREAEARRFHECEPGCNTFYGSPPDIVKKMPKTDLVEEVCTLQVAVNEQIQFTESSQQEYKRLLSEKVVCRSCFQMDIGVVLLPCRHRILCRMCGDKCSNCPICTVSIAKLVCVYYA